MVSFLKLYIHNTIICATLSLKTHHMSLQSKCHKDIFPFIIFGLHQVKRSLMAWVARPPFFWYDNDFSTKKRKRINILSFFFKKKNLSFFFKIWYYMQMTTFWESVVWHRLRPLGTLSHDAARLFPFIILSSGVICHTCSLLCIEKRIIIAFTR